MKIVVFSQARMDSTRLPGKVLKRVHGRTLLAFHVERLKKANKIDFHCIVTSTTNDDDDIANEALSLGVKVHRGSKLDVLARFKTAADELKLRPDDLVIRVTADCPLIDGHLIDNLIEHYLNARCDYANIDVTTIPRGFDAEIFSVATLNHTYLKAHQAYEREHVTPYIYQHQDEFNCSRLSFFPTLHPEFRLCVDEPEDLNVFEKIVGIFREQIIDVTAQDIVSLLEERPDIATLNMGVTQKQLGQ